MTDCENCKRLQDELDQLKSVEVTVEAQDKPPDESPQEPIDETQRQGVDERVARRTRLPKVNPPTKSHDKTPKRPANNDPTKTPRGRASVRRQGAKNKKHAAKFKKYAESLDRIFSASLNEAADLVDELNDPVGVCIELNRVISEGTDSDGKAAATIRTIHNVWEDKLIERYAGLCNPTPADELALFETVVSLHDELKQFGAEFVWVERIKKPTFVMYKVCADQTPSRVFTERKCLGDRNIILSTDHANIIEIVHGDR